MTGAKWRMDVIKADALFTVVLLGHTVNGVILMIVARMMTIVNAPSISVRVNVLYSGSCIKK